MLREFNDICILMSLRITNGGFVAKAAAASEKGDGLSIRKRRLAHTLQH